MGVAGKAAGLATPWAGIADSRRGEGFKELVYLVNIDGRHLIGAHRSGPRCGDLPRIDLHSLPETQMSENR